MENMLFGKGGVKNPTPEGIFYKIGNDVASRSTSKVTITKDIALGNTRGQNIHVYRDNSTKIARILLGIYEKGGRYTDQDIAGIIPVTPDVGGTFSLPDSTKVAQTKFINMTNELKLKLTNILGETTLGLSGQGAKLLEAQRKANQINQIANSSESEFTMGQIYKDNADREAEYLGKDPDTGAHRWQITNK